MFKHRPDLYKNLDFSNLPVRYFIILFSLLLLSNFNSKAQTLPDACIGGRVRYGVEASLPNSTFIWTVNGGNITVNYNDSVDIQWDYNRTIHSISVREVSEFGCEGITVEADVLVKGPLANIGDEAEVCQNNEYIFDATNNYAGGVTYLWQDGSTGNTFASGNEGYVWVKITGTDLCYDYDSTYLTVNPLPVVNIGRDTTLCGTSMLSIDAGFFASYEWSNGNNGNPATFDGDRSEPETVWVQVTDNNGCVGSDTLILGVCDATLLFVNMPNTITPGDNEKNNEWIIPYIELFPDAVIEIFDRWGRLVYHTNDIANNPWKGETMSGKELPMDAYYYVLDLKIPHVKPLTGYVNIIR